MSDPQTATTPKAKETLPLSQLTPAQRKARYDELRARLGRSQLAVKGKPGLHYFWAHATDDSEMIRLETIGYWVVKEPEAEKVLKGEKKPEIEAVGLRADGTYKKGDVMLMACPMDIYEFIMLDTEQRGKDFQQAAKDNFRIEAESVGAPTFEVDRSKKG